jgi:hypothetical protein
VRPEHLDRREPEDNRVCRVLLVPLVRRDPPDLRAASVSPECLVLREARVQPEQPEAREWLDHRELPDPLGLLEAQELPVRRDHLDQVGLLDPLVDQGQLD